MSQSISKDPEKQAIEAYNLISKKANVNAIAQGAGGIFGTLVSAALDLYALKFYSDLWDEIREIYDHEPYEEADVETIIPKLGKEILADIIFDKVLGYIPLIGIPANAMCAKTLTWRLGILFAFLSSRGSEVPDDQTIKAVRLIREMYPQKEMFSFTTPDKNAVTRMVMGVADITIGEFDDKISKALKIFS